MTCLIDPCFKISFLNETEVSVFDSWVQIALNLTPAHIREEPQSTNTAYTAKTLTVTSEEKGMAWFLKKITSARQQMGEEHPIVKALKKRSERRVQICLCKNWHSSREGSTGMVDGPCIRAASPCQGC